MLEARTEFVNKIISFGGFKRSEISNKSYAELLTNVEGMLEQGVAVIPSLMN